MYKNPAILNNYRTILHNEPIRGLRNIIAGSDNTGNILFLETIGSQIQNCTPINIYTECLADVEDFMSKYDALILPMANMVSSSWASDDMVTFLEKHNIPIILISVGVQVFDIEELHTFTLSRDAKRLLDLAKERSTSIGVRGEYTAKYLSDLGYNVRIIGCPSAFARFTSPVARPSLNKIATHATLSGYWRESLISFFEFGQKYAQSYVAQNEARLLADAYNLSDDVLKEWVYDESRLRLVTENKLYEYSYYSSSAEKAESFRNWIKQSLTFFTDIDKWMKHLSSFDFVVGTRFHGNMVGILAGVPSLLLTTDLRVQELAEYHKLPHYPLTSITKDTTPEELFSQVDFTDYLAYRSQAHNNYLEFLKENNLLPT